MQLRSNKKKDLNCRRLFNYYESNRERKQDALFN